MVDVGEGVWGPAWERLYDSLGGNPWAAMPSLHFATSVMAAMLLAEIGPVPGRRSGPPTPATLGFALVYLGEHYVTDLLAGAAVVALVRRGEPLAEPAGRRRSTASCSGSSGSPRPRPRRRRRTGRVCQDRSRMSRSESERRGRMGSSPTSDARAPDVRARARARRRRGRGRRRGAERSSRTRSGSPQTALIVVLLVARRSTSCCPELAGVEDVIEKLGKGDPVWIAIALRLRGRDVRLLRRAVPRRRRRARSSLRWSESYEITMAGLAATRLFSAGGAGGIVLTYWALRKAGMPRKETAARMVAFLVLLYAVYMITLVDQRDPAADRGLLRAGAAGLTIVPAAIAGGVIIVFLLDRADPGRPRAALLARPRRSSFWGRMTRRLATVPVDARGRHPRGDRLRARALARRARGRRRDRLLGGAHRRSSGPRFKAFDVEVPMAVVVQGFFVGMFANLLPLPGGVGGVDAGHDRRLRPVRPRIGDGRSSPPCSPTG